MEENIVSPVNAEPAAIVEPQQTDTPVQEQASEPVKTDNVEVVEPQQDKKQQSPEENAKFAQIRREYEAKIKSESEAAAQRARDEFIASQGYEWNGKPIKTEAEYKEAVREAELRKQYEQSQLPEEVVKELIESKKYREQQQERERQFEEQQKKQQDYQAFLSAYPDVKADEIPVEVWEENAKGKSLVDAYAKHEVKILKQKLAEYEKGQKAQQANVQNAQTSPGSVTGNGSVNADFITYDAFETNKHDQGWLMKNYNKIMESRKKW